MNFLPRPASVPLEGVTDDALALAALLPPAESIRDMTQTSWLTKVLPNLLLALFLPCLGYFAGHFRVFPLSRTPQSEEAESVTRPATARESAQEDDIREAVLHERIGGGDGTPYFLWVTDGRGMDPNSAVLRRLGGGPLHVEPGTRAVTTGTAQVHDRVTGRPGTVVLLSAVRWVSDREVEVDATSCRQPSQQDNSTYRLTRRKKKWAVAEVRHG